MKNSHVMTMMIVTFVSVILSACGSSQMQSETPEIAEYRLYSSNQCNIFSANEALLSSAKGFSSYSKLQSLMDQPIDWENEKALLVTMGSKASLGYSMSLGNIISQAQHWQVSKLVSEPKKGKLYGQAVTTPCSLLVMPRSVKSLSLYDEKGDLLNKW